MADETIKTSGRRWAGWTVGILLACIALGGVFFWLAGRKVWTDGAELRTPDSQARLREVLWTSPKPLIDFNSLAQEYEPSISPDGAELYFVRGKPGHNADIFVSYRRDNAWTAPAALEGINTEYDELGPRLTADGHFLLFYSNRPGGLGGYDIWAAPRIAGGFAQPFNLGVTINSEFDEYSPAPTPDGKRLFFATNRTAASRQQKQAWQATIRATANSDFDLWMADADPLATPSIIAPTSQPSSGVDLADAAAPATRPVSSQAALAFKNAMEVPGINTPFMEGASCMSPANDFLYFTSNRPGGFGKFDIYRCRVSGDSFGPVENLGPTINTAENEADPQLAMGGFRIVFSSDRGEAMAGYHLLESDSHEVFPERQGRLLPHLGWSWLILLASLLALVPLLLFMRRWDEHKLNLLQKCLLVSLLIHVLLTFWFSFIKVSQQIVQLVRQETGMEVTVNLNPSREGEVGMAIRQQSSSDLPVSIAPPGELAQSEIGAEIVGPQSGVQVNVPAAGAGSQPLLVQVPAPRISAPKPTDDVKIQPTPRAPSEAIDVKIALSPQLSAVEAVPQAAAVQSPAQRMNSTVGPRMIGEQVKIDSTPAGPSRGSLAEMVGPARPSMPVMPLEVGPRAAAPQVTKAPNVQGPRAAIAPIASKNADMPIAPEAQIGAARQAAPSGSNSGGGPVAAVPSASPGAGGAQSIVESPGAADPGAAAANLARGVGAAVNPAGATGAEAAAAAAPRVAGPPVVAGPIAGSGPDILKATESGAAPSGRQETAGAADAGPVIVNPGAPASATTGGSMAAAPPVGGAGEGSLGGIGRNAVAPAVIAAATGGGVRAPLGRLNVAVSPGAPVAAGERLLSDAIAAATSVAPTTRSSGLDSGIEGAGAADDIGAIATRPASPDKRSTLAMALPTTHNVMSTSDAALAGPAIGKVTGSTAAQLAGPINVAGPKVTVAPLAAATGNPQASAAVPAAEKIQGGVASSAGRHGAAIGDLATAGSAAPSTSSRSAGSLAASVSPSPRTIVVQPNGQGQGTGQGPGIPGVPGPQLGMPQIASAAKVGSGQGSPSGTGYRPGGGPDGGPLASAQRSAAPGGAAGTGGPGPLALLASGSIPKVGTAIGPGPGGDDATDSAGPIRPRLVQAPVALVAPELAAAGPKITAPEALFQRSVEQRRPLIEKRGGTKESENAVDRGLAYLARQQEPDGRWTWVTDDGKPGRRQPNMHDMAFTGLATLAFLAADHSPGKEGPYRETVTRAVDYLVAHQADDGDLRGLPQMRGGGSDRANMYDHGIATMAVAEAALMTGDKDYTDAALKAAEFIIAKQNRQSGGWRYLPQEPGDTSVFGWQILALHDAEQLGFQIPENARARMLRYLRLVSHGEQRMLAGYMPGEGPTLAMTAEALFSRILLGDPISDAAAREVSEFLTQELPDNGGADLYFWYYASLSLSQMQQVQPEAWNKWNTRCRDTLIHMQKRGGAGDGSWENSRWNDRGGRIFTTSLATLTLEVYYRYLPLNPDAPEVDDGRRAADKKIQHGWEREQAPRQRNRAEPN